MSGRTPKVGRRATAAWESRRSGSLPALGSGASSRLITHGGSRRTLVALLDPTERVFVARPMGAATRTAWAQTEPIAAQCGMESRFGPGVPAPPSSSLADTGAVRWASPNHRWTAELHSVAYRRSRPGDQQVILVDTKGCRAKAALSESPERRTREAERLDSATAGKLRLVRERIARSANASYRDMAPPLHPSRRRGRSLQRPSAIHRQCRRSSGTVRRGRTNLEILSATDSGWTARRRIPVPGHLVASPTEAASPKRPARYVAGRRITWVEGSVWNSLSARRLVTGRTLRRG